MLLNYKIKLWQLSSLSCLIVEPKNATGGYPLVRGGEVRGEVQGGIYQIKAGASLVDVWSSRYPNDHRAHFVAVGFVGIIQPAWLVSDFAGRHELSIIKFYKISA